MSSSSVQHPIVAIVVAIAIAGGIGYGIYYHVVKAPKNRAQDEQALFAPYFTALSEGQINAAWERFTTPRYKALFPLERYRQHWEQVFAKRGRITKRVLAAANDAYEATTKRTYESVKYQLTFERDYVQAVNEVVPDAGGNPRIDWAGRHELTSSLTAPEPW
jgi:hypothetical protein